MEPNIDSESPFTYDPVHCDYVCKGCGAWLRDIEVEVVVSEDRTRFVEMAHCPLCGYPHTEGVTVDELERQLEFDLEGCDEPEWTFYNEMLAAIGRYKYEKKHREVRK